MRKCLSCGGDYIVSCDEAVDPDDQHKVACAAKIADTRGIRCLNEEEKSMLLRHNIIGVIKSVQHRLHLDLIAAKKLVSYHRNHMGT